MPLDPSIILSGKPAQLPNLEDVVRLRDLDTRAQVNQMALAQQQRALASQQTLANLYAQNTSPTGAVNDGAISAGMAQAGYGEQVPALLQQQRATDKANLDQQASALDLQKKKFDFVNQRLGSLLSLPNLTQNDVIGALSSAVQEGIIDPQKGAQFARSLPGDPGQLRALIRQTAAQSLDATAQLQQQQQKFQQVDTGGNVVLGSTDPNTGAFTPHQTVQKTATPGEILTDKRTRDMTTDLFTPQEAALMGSLAQNGISIPAGLRSKAQMKATFGALLANNPGLTPDEITEKIATGQINFGAEKKETTTAAAQAGRVSTAVNELSTFGDQALAASAAVPRGNFIPVNKLMQMANSQISDPALLTLKLKLNALNNAYNVLSSRGGTDAASRAHVQQLFSSANGPEGVAALVTALKQEGAGALSSARAATHVQPAAAAATTSDVPPDIQALIDKHGGQ